MSTRAESAKIRDFITDNVADYPYDIAARTAAKFDISRQGVHRHLRNLQFNGVLSSEGQTKGAFYKLRVVREFQHSFSRTGLEEHVPWEKNVAPLLASAPECVQRICNYGFTEMLNNAIDHSQSERVAVSCECDARNVTLRIVDHGIGIFRKIRDAFGLEDEWAAIIELSKGKLTTDKENHTGEGIFFTSRVFDRFAILSGSLYFSHKQDGDWLLEDKKDPSTGTSVVMSISLNSIRTLTSVFDSFTAETDGSMHFSKTHVPIELLNYGDENLVSRSQAKRILARLELFKEVLLDFGGVKVVGQAFADEIFRVYQNEHPDVRLQYMDANADVESMIQRAIHRRLHPEDGLATPEHPRN